MSNPEKELSLKERLEQIKNQGNPSDVDETEAQNLLNDNTEETPDSPDYRKLIKDDMDNLTDEEFSETRKEAFDAVKEEFKPKTETVQSNESKPIIKPKSKLEAFEEKNPIIMADPNNKPKEAEPDDAGSDLINSLHDIDKNSQDVSKLLYEEQAKYEEKKLAQTTESSIVEDANSDDIEDILNNIDEMNSKKDMGLEDVEEDNLTALLEKLESQKLYAQERDDNILVTASGPADYTIEEDPDYQEVVEDVLTTNGFNVIKKNNKDKNALLERFVNADRKVTVPLVNSGIYITVSGASVTEIISMNQISGDTDYERILNKLNIINNHIVGSSIGKMKLSQLIKVISYYDIETLNYAFYAATHPEVSEITRNCNRCGQEYFIKQHTRDLLINPEDYADEASEIRNNVTTYERLLATTQLNKVVKKVCAKGNLIVCFKHPSIESYIKTARDLQIDTIRAYPQLVDMAYAIDKVYLRDSGTNYVEYSDPNSIIDIIGKLKNNEVKYELLDILEEIRPCAIPSYGYNDTICPHCGNKDKSEAFSMENLLFTVAQQEDEMSTLRWAAKLQERRKSKKK